MPTQLILPMCTIPSFPRVRLASRDASRYPPLPLRLAPRLSGSKPPTQASQAAIVEHAPALYGQVERTTHLQDRTVDRAPDRDTLLVPFVMGRWEENFPRTYM